jgi:hypothetical protein
VWCIDFKGHFRTDDGVVCYPLTITDAYSRFLLCCTALVTTEAVGVRRVMTKVFDEFGLPDAIRSDNGTPFASTAAGGLTHLSAWWMKLGIRLERIEPGKPQQNGRHERFHLTLKQETASPPAPTLIAQQRRFDRFRQQYNHDRPHEALSNKTPNSCYQRSSRKRPSLLPGFTYPFAETRTVDHSGHIIWNKARLFITEALANESIGVRRIGDHYCEMLFGPITLGVLDEKQKNRGLVRYKVDRRRVSAMSPV